MKGLQLQNYSHQNISKSSKIDQVIQKIILDYEYDSPNFLVEDLYSPIIREKLENFHKINLLINSILLKYNDSSLVSFKNDGLIVLVFKKICIKIFSKKNIISRNLDMLFNILLKNECEYLEHIYEIIDSKNLDILIVVSKTVDTTDFKERLKEDTLIINEDIIKALNYLGNNNWMHNDTRIDNIGYDQELNKYVLFDFDMSKFSDNFNEIITNKINDINKLNISINFNLNLERTLY